MEVVGFWDERSGDCDFGLGQSGRVANLFEWDREVVVVVVVSNFGGVTALARVPSSFGLTANPRQFADRIFSTFTQDPLY